MYRVLYRKWRPRTFDEVSGQPHITSTLSHELESGRVSHAYLFTGSRGTGKTSCAKILAKAVNCLSPVNGSPCCKCEICTGIDDGSVLDIIEIDAASNNGVDNIRDLREEANFSPVKAKYRVYIIDEVHMLSISAFNALLKTLEEPPDHVIFILATTEVHKLPATILSRCQRFDFRRIPPEDIADRLTFVAENEGISLERGAALLIARIADGALRDALSILDRCSVGGEPVTQKLVSEASGLAGRDYLFKMSQHICSGDTAAALMLLDELHNGSCDMEQLVSELINHFRNLMIVKTVSSPSRLIVCQEEELEQLRSQASLMTLETVLYSLRMLEDSVYTLKNVKNKRIEAELLLVRLCSPSLNESNSALLRRISVLEANLKGSVSIPAAKNSEALPAAEAPAPPVPPVASPKPLDSSEFEFWPDILDTLGEFNPAFAGILNGSSAELENGKIKIISQSPAVASFLLVPANEASLNAAAVKVTGEEYKFFVSTTEKKSAKAVDPLSELFNKINSK